MNKNYQPFRQKKFNRKNVKVQNSLGKHDLFVMPVVSLHYSQKVVDLRLLLILLLHLAVSTLLLLCINLSPNIHGVCRTKLNLDTHFTGILTV